jgi:dihydrofolate reductase
MTARIYHRCVPHVPEFLQPVWIRVRYWAKLLLMGRKTYTTVKDGDWDDPTVWYPRNVPTRLSDVVVRHKVTLNHSIEVGEWL